MNNTLWAYLGKRHARPRTCLGDVSEVSTGYLSKFDKIMPADMIDRRLPRKWWEWDYIAECAEVLGLLDGKKTALGLGVGVEPLIFYFANHCESVIATDLYAEDTAWKEARVAGTAAVLDASPIPYPRDRVRVENADMRSTGVPAGSVDFVWSCSSIEHIPTLIDLFEVFKEIDRVLKVGGYAILTTEYSVTGNPYLLPGVNAWNAEIFQLVRDSLTGFEFVGEVDLNFNAVHPGNGVHPRRYLPFSSMSGASKELSYLYRGGTMANPVGVSIIAPIAFVIRKKDESGVQPWGARPVSELVRRYTEGVAAFSGGDNDTAIEHLEAVLEDGNADIQLSLLAFRFAIDAHVRRNGYDFTPEIADRIEAFLDGLPKLAVTDADALDICAHILGEAGRVERALSVYEACLASPSTVGTHVNELLVRYVSLASRTGHVERAAPFAAGIIVDLITFGAPKGLLLDEILSQISRHCPDDVVAGVKRNVDEKLHDVLNESERKKYEGFIEDIYKTSSWKVTKPLRYAGKTLKRIERRLRRRGATG